MPRRRKKRGGGDEGGAPETAGMMRWLISYADFITLLSAIFFIWFATAQVDREKFKQFVQGFQQATNAEKQVKGGAGLLNQENVSHTIKPPIAPGLVPRRERIAQRIETMAKKMGLGKVVSTSVNQRGIVIELLTESDQPLFDLGKADLKEKAKDVMKRIVWIIQNEQIKEPIRIEGHTDSLPISTAEFPSNWELSTRRATNVLRFMIQMGLPAGQLEAAGYADTKPKVPNRAGGTPENRRVDVIILMGEASKR